MKQEIKTTVTYISTEDLKLKSQEKPILHIFHDDVSDRETVLKSEVLILKHQNSYSLLKSRL